MAAIQTAPAENHKRGITPEVDSAFAAAISASGIFPRNGPDSSARSWGHKDDGTTFGAQHKLPSLPLPSLESSCSRYLTALEPLSTQEELEASSAAVKNFLGQEGPVLQAQLEAYNAQQDNWFENFGYEAFLGDDSPVVWNSNAFCSFPEDPEPSRHDWVSRATTLVRAAVSFSQDIRHDILPLDEVRGVPLCMNQYWWLFGVTRVPTSDGGRLRLDVDSKHIVVFCRGQIYCLQVLQGPSDTIIDEYQLRKQLWAIIIDAELPPNKEATQSSIGVLTTENQKVWSRCRELLVHDGVQNGRNLAIIDSALFALCLDSNRPETRTDVCKNMIGGTKVFDEDGVQVGSCLNRWYDKLSVIVCQNGAAGMNFEHTCTDGSVDIGMACEIYKRSTQPSGNEELTNGAKADPSSSSRTVAQKLDWRISQELSGHLGTAVTSLETRLSQYQLATLDIKDYGKAFIKSNGFPPDAFFQIALQAAYFRTYGQIRSGFEPVHTRQYLHGRTDVVRTTTVASAEFAKMFPEETIVPSQKIQSMRRATEAHVALSKDCAKGLSHHRHLGVLQKMWKGRQSYLKVAGLASAEEDNVTIFTDPGWSRLGTTILTGSNVDNPYIAYAGFGPLSEDGFTVTYYIRDDHIAMSVTSRNGQAETFAEAIEGTLQTIKRMLDGLKS